MQYQAGYDAFKTNKQWTKRLPNGKTIIITSNPYPEETMQAKEWARGYNKAYFINLEESHRR